MSLYLNGISISGTIDVSGGALAYDNTSGPTIGNFADGCNVSVGYQGKIDDVRTYDHPLTPIQAKLLYNDNAAVRFAPLTGSPYDKPTIHMVNYILT